MLDAVPAKLEMGRVTVGPYGTVANSGFTGMFLVQAPLGTWRLGIVATEGTVEGAKGWEHVSVSTQFRTPTWEEMCYVKDLFWKPEEAVFQLHPPASTYVNNHPYCLHLWRNIHVEILLPPPSFVGVKDEGVLRGPEHAQQIREKLGL